MVSHPLDVEKDREIPVPAQLGAMQEDAIEEENRGGGGLLFGRIDKPISLDIEDRPPDRPEPPGLSGSSRTLASVA
jgi:hypothetical protein